jgi:DNA-binding MurR/RpiR family transcriptional regulator
MQLLLEVRRRLPQLSRGQSRVAQYVLDQPGTVKDIRLKDLCGACDTSEPVVFAFCQALGFDGFRSFKTALAVDLGAHAGRTEDLPIQDAELHASGDPGLFLRTLSGLYLRSIRETVASLVPAQFQAAVDALERARRIVLFGVGVSGNVGFVAQQNFLRTGTPVTWTNDPNLNFTHLAPLEKGDVCLALSQTGSQKDTLEGAAFAKRRGITVIAITSDPDGPLADLADILLLTAPVAVPAVTHFSIGAQLATPVLLVTDALAVALGARRKKAMEERSRATAEAMKPRTVRSRRRLSGFS